MADRPKAKFEEVQDEVKLSFKEFFDTLDRKQQLIGKAMELQFKGEKMSKEKWLQKFNEFANSVVE